MNPNQNHERKEAEQASGGNGGQRPSFASLWTINLRGATLLTFARNFNMPVSSIAQVFIRLYALKILVGALASFGGILSMVNGATFSALSLFLGLLPNLLVITAGVVLWMFAPWLSRLLTKKGNGDLTLEGVTREDLFAAVLLLFYHGLVLERARVDPLLRNEPF